MFVKPSEVEATRLDPKLGLYGDGGLSSLTDHNDWQAIAIIFARTANGQAGFLSAINPQRTLSFTQPVGDDVQPVIGESPASLRLLLNYYRQAM